MNEADEKELLRMTREIYHHLGLDCHKVISLKSVSEKAKKDVLKWKEKQLKRGA